MPLVCDKELNKADYCNFSLKNVCTPSPWVGINSGPGDQGPGTRGPTGIRFHNTLLHM